MYTAKEIDSMSIEDIDSLAQMLNEEQRNKWAGYGYSGDGYIKITEKINE